MDLKTLSETLKNAIEEAGKGIMDQNPMNLPQGGDGIGGTSQDQKVKKRKTRDCGKLVKKKKMIYHPLRAIGEENEEIKDENDSMVQKLRLKQDEIKQQKAEFWDSQNKIITAHENLVGALLQELFVQHLMAESNQLEIAPNANSDDRMPSEDDIIELKHRSKMLDMQIEVLCRMMTE